MDKTAAGNGFEEIALGRFATTKRAFDDFLKTIRELKKLRCCVLAGDGMGFGGFGWRVRV